MINRGTAAVISLGKEKALSLFQLLEHLSIPSEQTQAKVVTFQCILVMDDPELSRNKTDWCAHIDSRSVKILE